MDEQRPAGPAESVEPPSPELLRELRDRAHAMLAEQRSQAESLEQQMSAEIGRISDSLAEAFALQSEEAAADAAEKAASQLADERDAFVAERTEWEQLRDEIEGNLETLRESLQQQAATQQTRQREIAEADASLATKKQELARWASELAEQREQIESARRELQKQEENAASAQANAGAADELAEKLRTAETDRDALKLEVRRLEADLETANAATAVASPNDDAIAQACEAAEAEWQSERKQLASEIEGLQTQLAAHEGELRTAHEVGRAAEELEEKFSLALEDVQQQRRRIAELEQELATRPAADADESAELASLRAERDDLQQEISELRSRPAASTDADPTEMDDLRRRFELAVEDLRQLKTDNAELEQRLAATAGAASEAVGDGLDWESQKRRMLASLEGEDGEASPTAAEDRATIEGTIRITDQVVAEKEQRIAELESMLAAPTGEGSATPAVVLEDDQRLEAERERLATLEQEWEEKLRAAELELSVERAKLAREQAEMAELKIELEAQQRRLGNKPADSASPGESKSQRNWFNKLGLGGGEGE